MNENASTVRAAGAAWHAPAPACPHERRLVRWPATVAVLLGSIAAMAAAPADNVIRFAIQGDLHNFRRVPEDYMRRLLGDAAGIECLFVAVLGDVLDGTKNNPMRLSRDSRLPVVWHAGDHEYFGEWGRTAAGALSRCHPYAGEAPDPVVCFRGAMPRFEALAGRPTAWAAVLRGVLFIFVHSGKNHVWHDWQLDWLRELLAAHRGRTAVILSHRALNEYGETADNLRRLLGEFPGVVLFCDAHTHSAHPFNVIGNVLQVGAEGNSPDAGKLTFEGDWYVVIELAPSRLRVLRRRMGTGELDTLHERQISTTVRNDDSGSVHLAFVMSDCGVRFNPAVHLGNARLRVWGMRQEQLLAPPGPQQDGWRSRQMQTVEADDSWQRMGLAHVWQATPDAGDIVAETTVPVDFEPDWQKVGVAGSVARPSQYSIVMLARAPKGRRIRLEVDAELPDGSPESRHWVETVADGDIAFLQVAVGHVYLGSQTVSGERRQVWRWEGVDGRTEIDYLEGGRPRRAARLCLRLRAPGAPPTPVQFAGFAFPHRGGFFTAAPQGTSFTQSAVVRLRGRAYEFGSLSPGRFGEAAVGDLAGGEEISLSCGGSRLALVELVGQAAGLMGHVLREVRTGAGGDAGMGAPTRIGESFRFYRWTADVNGTTLWRWRDNTWQFIPAHLDAD